MTLDELKKRLQSHLGDGLLLVVGSGVSCAEGMPGMGALATHLRADVATRLTGADLAEWPAFDALIMAKGLEPALLEKAPPPGIELAIVNSTGELMAQHERNVVVGVFTGARTLRLSKLIEHLVKPTSGIPIITTNYDRLVEIAVEEAGLGVDTMFVGDFAGRLDERESRLSFCRDGTVKRGKVRLKYQSRAIVYKPHGSLDWYLRNNTPVRYGGELPIATRLIITPGHNKFRNGYDSPFDHHRARANEAIDRASRFLILGYGFNDDHLQTHLTPAIQRGRPTLILVRSLSPAARHLAESNGSIIAIESAEEGGITGSRVIADKSVTFIPASMLWDLEGFVDEVL